MINYEGIFFLEEELEKLFSNEGHFLGNRNDLPHITFSYKPDGKHLIEDVIGQDVTCYLTSYGCNGENSAFLATFPEEFESIYYNSEDKGERINPHITVSLADNAKAANSRNLTFVKLKEPIPIKGKFGYWIKDDGKEYALFEKILPKKKQS